VRHASRLGEFRRADSFIAGFPEVTGWRMLQNFQRNGDQEMLGLFRRPSTNAFRRSFDAWSICFQNPTK
jgi:hypothetical protein